MPVVERTVVAEWTMSVELAGPSAEVMWVAFRLAQSLSNLATRFRQTRLRLRHTHSAMQLIAGRIVLYSCCYGVRKNLSMYDTLLSKRREATAALRIITGERTKFVYNLLARTARRC